MNSRNVVRVVVLNLMICPSAFGQIYCNNQQPKLDWSKNSSRISCKNSEVSKNRFLMEVAGGYYNIPGGLFDFDNSIVEHPPHLIGFIRTFRLGFNLKESLSLGGQYFKLEASGGGNWARSDTAEVLTANNIAGVIIGKTEWKLEGFVLDVEKTFLSSKDKVRPFMRLGGGLGEVTVNFQGEFRGHETLSGFDFPVVEPAVDKVKRKIPIINVETGLRFEPKKYFNFSVSGYWNTGYGVKLGLETKF